MVKLIIAVFLSFIFSGEIFVSAEAKYDVNEILIKIFKYANAHDLVSLNELGKEIEQFNDRTLKNGFSLALYIAAPDKYRRQFVDNFPESYEGIGYDLFHSIEIEQLTPSFLYSFESLGLIAVEGDVTAIKKVILGASATDGVIGQTFCEYVVKALDVQQNKTIFVYAQLSIKDRQESYKCFDVASADELAPVKEKLEKLEKLKIKVPASEALVIDEMDKYISHVLANQKY